jgi:hypothetical protein
MVWLRCMFFQSHRYYHAISPILCLFCWFCALCRKKWLTLRGRFGNRPYSQAVSLAETEAAKVTKIFVGMSWGIRGRGRGADRMRVSASGG